MQQNLNNKQAKKVRFVLDQKFFTELKGLDQKLFQRKITMEYIRQCGDVYYHDEIPVAVNLEIRTTRRVTSTQKENKFVTKLPIITMVTDSVTRSLVGTAYDSVRQVAELYATKLHGNEDRIIVEIERI